MGQLEEYNTLYDLESCQEDDLVMVGDMVESMYDQLVKFQPDVNLENLMIDVDIDENMV